MVYISNRRIYVSIKNIAVKNSRKTVSVAKVEHREM